MLADFLACERAFLYAGTGPEKENYRESIITVGLTVVLPIAMAAPEVKLEGDQWKSSNAAARAGVKFCRLLLPGQRGSSRCVAVT